MNASGSQLIAAYLPEKGLVDEEIHSNGSITLKGVLPKILDELATYANFSLNRFTLSYSAVKCPDGSYGLQYPNGSWSGIVGMLNRGDAHIGMTDIYMTYERSKAVDFSKVYEFVPHAILSGQKRVKGSAGQDIMVNILKFDKRIWISLFCCALMFMFITSLSQSMRRPHFCSRFIRNLGKQWLIMTGILTEAGPVAEPRTRSEKLILIIFLFASTMTMIFLDSEFSTNLVVPAQIRFPDSREALVKSKTFKPGLQIGSAIEGKIEASDSGIYGMINKRIREGKGMLIPGNDLQTSKTYSDVAIAHIALINGLGTLKGLSNGICEEFPDTMLHFSRETFFSTPLGMVFSNFMDKKMRKKANVVITRLFESGILPFWREKAENSEIRCFAENVGSGNAENNAITLINLRGLFIIMVVGIGMAVAVFFTEIICERIQKLRKK